MAQDPYKYFRVEAQEIVDDLGQGLLALEKGPPAPDLVPKLLRLAHTLKGAARVVKQGEIADLAHGLEDLLGPLREDPASGPQRVTRALHILDAVATRVKALAQPDPAAAPSTHSAIVAPEAVPRAAPLKPAAPDSAPAASAATPPAPAEEKLRTLRADVAQMDELLHGISEVSVQLSTTRRGADAVEALHDLAERLVDQLSKPGAGGAAGRDALRARATAEELRRRAAGLRQELAVGFEQTDRELRQVREAAEQLRLLPAGLMFHALERTARDAAASLGKQVTFEAAGGDVKMDADVLNAVQGALVQAVRNAVAHGVESPAERTAAGKPASGRILLEVARRGGRVAFTCRDDGRGIDVQAVRHAAQRKGLLPPGTGVLDSDALLRLLLKGGVSTSGAVTEISGRGIGLDVVGEAARRLGGTVSLRTQPRAGTTLELVVPVSLASLDALVVEAAGQRLAIPMDAVRRTVRVTAAELARTPEGDAIAVEDAMVPFVPLPRMLGAEPEATPRRAWSAVVIEGDGATVALGVDRLVGAENVVLRPLPGGTPATPTVAGASLDLEGNPQLVLDAAGLVAEARRTVAPPQIAPVVRKPILVIDDSLTTRMLEQSILESAGYDVDLATSAEEALEKARFKQYGLFLVDVEMPGMDGFTFVGRTRDDPSLKDTPAILVTSLSSPEDKRRGEEAGACAYIVKSEFDQGSLLERIRKLVG
jgi:two-component system chemotaxis sensor kinase CheA